MTITQTRSLKVLTFVRIHYDDGALDGLLIDNQKDSEYVSVWFPRDNTSSTVNRDQIDKAGKTLELNFDDSGLWE